MQVDQALQLTWMFLVGPLKVPEILTGSCHERHRYRPTIKANHTDCGFDNSTAIILPNTVTFNLQLRFLATTVCREFGTTVLTVPQAYNKRVHTSSSSSRVFSTFTFNNAVVTAPFELIKQRRDKTAPHPSVISASGTYRCTVYYG
jgi:hypothetical protein